MKIAAQMMGYFLPFFKKGETISFSFAGEALTNVKEMGYDGVQLSGFGRLTEEIITFYKETCQGLNLEIVATHIPFPDLTDKMDLVISAHNEWQCQLCGIGSMPAVYQKSYDSYIEFAHFLEVTGNRLSQENISFMYHAHAFEYIKYNGKHGLDILMDETTAENVKLLPDTYWAQYGGNNPVELIKKYANRIETIHLKDMKVVTTTEPGNGVFDFGKPAICHLGEGNINFIPILAELKKLNIPWLIIEQDYSLNDDINGDYKKSLKFLRGII